MNYEEFKEKVTSYGQDHLLNLYERLDDEGKEKLLNQIEKIDFGLVKDLFELTKKKIESKDFKIQSIDACDANLLTEEEKNRYIEIGTKAIKEGKTAVVMMAGGQGTRLGFDGPKGTFDFGLDNHMSIFETYAVQFKKARDEFGVSVPWYIMTSRENDKATNDFFEAHNYFGYKEGIKTFIQNELPMLDEQGKLIVDKNGLVKEAANGHGGTFDAIVSNKILDEFKEKNIELILTCNVDNILCKMVDPLAVGYVMANNFLATSISCFKGNPDERIGVLCLKDDIPGVIEYTEIPDDIRYAKKENGEPLLSEGHINVNYFSVKLIEEVAKEQLPYHVAHKKSDIVDVNGNVIVPDEPNAYKFEMFIFDAFERLDRLGVLRYKREECFAPIKNATGVDSPETARELYKKFHGIS